MEAITGKSSSFTPIVNCLSPFTLHPWSPPGPRKQKGSKAQDMESSKLTKKRAGRKRQRSRSPALPKRNILGCRISHKWKEGDESITQWNGTVLDQVPVNPSLYLVKYDGIDSVHALELYKDKRVLSIKLSPRGWYHPESLIPALLMP